MYYIYKITNRLDGKVYIGKTTNPKSRWGKHQFEGGPKGKLQSPLYKAMREVGIDNFEFEIIETIADATEAKIAEEEYTEHVFKSNKQEFGYNIAIGAKLSDETRAKISEAARNMSDETRAKISEANRNRSAETRAKISEAKRGENHPMFGKKHSDEAKAKIGAASRNRSDEAKAKMSAAKRGKKLSEVAILRRSITVMKRTRDTLLQKLEELA